MKKQGILGLVAVFALTALLSGCKIIGEVEYTIEQNPVEMHGDSVRVNITVKIPEKGLHKKASAELTPKLGDKAFKSVAIQGEKAAGNGQTIAKKTGGTVNYKDVIAYTPDMENADLTVSGTATKGKKEIEVPVTKIADGTIVTPLLVQNDDKALIGADAFVRTTEKTYDLAQINYLKGKHDVRGTEMSDKDIKALTEWLKAAEVNPKIEPKKVNLVAYASFEGDFAKNDELAANRATSGNEAMDKIVKSAKFTAPITYNKMPKGEDFAGFKTMVEASNLQDKDLILRVLQMYTDPAQREKEITNMAATYTQLEKTILPAQRRTQLLVIYDHVGWSDDELKQLSNSKPDTLTIEELLFTATLYEDLNEKMRVYKLAQSQYADDWRGHNNVGYVYYLKNDLANAKSNFEKANGVNENPVTLNNLGIIARINGDRDKARELLKRATSAGSEVKYNLGIIDIQDGNYAEAIGNMGSNNTFNKALAQTLNKDYSPAGTTLNASPDKESAIGFYLKAILAARANDVDGVASNLKNAIAKDSSLKAKAAKDREFIKFFENATFKSVVGG